MPSGGGGGVEYITPNMRTLLTYSLKKLSEPSYGSSAQLACCQLKFDGTEVVLDTQGLENGVEPSMTR